VKLALKLALALFLGVLFVLAGHAYVRVQREIKLFECDIRHDSHSYGRALAAAVAEVFLVEGKTRAIGIVETANHRESHVRIRWVSLDAKPGDVDAPVVDASELAPLHEGQEIVAKVPQVGDVVEEHLVTYVPVTADQRIFGAIELAESLAGERFYVMRTLRNTTIATVVVALICGILATALGIGFVGRPINRLVEQARRIGLGDFSGRINLDQRDEISELAEEMNLMSQKLEMANTRIANATAARITALEQLRHADRLATVGKLAAGIAHELGAPLQVISGRARLLLDGDSTAADIEKSANVIIEQADRITRIVRQLLDFARRRSADRALADLRLIVRQPLALLTPLAAKSSVELVQVAADEPIYAEVDADQIQQAITNLVVNGIQAMKKGGKLSVSLRYQAVTPPSDVGGSEATFACVEVTDEGPGMPPEIAAHIFEPFFTTKDVGEGTGLGLSVTYGIVREHEGFIQVDSEVGKGSHFRVYLPRSERT